jgi:putative transposase
MARPPRLQIAGGIYHVTTRGVRGLPIFVDDHDRTYFLALLEAIARRYGWRVHAYCLMGNHYHLLIETPGEDLSSAMQRLNGDYAQWFNWRHGLKGHVFYRRFYSVLVQRDEHLLELSRYIVLNPVRAGLAPTAARWKWSSYRATASGAPPPFVAPAWLLSQFHPDPCRARRVYRRFVAEAPPRPRPP